MAKQNFYIGWLDSVPDKNRRTVKRFLFGLFLFIPLLSVTIVFFAKPFNDHKFELFNVKTFSGLYYESPFPVLILDDEYVLDGFDKHALLVGYGKNGALGLMRSLAEKEGNLNGYKITISGTLIYGDGRILIEIANQQGPKLKKNNHLVYSRGPSQAQEISLKGEIVDPKCWFGVMKPGDGKVHKSCAIRCISGGIPPVLRVKQAQEWDYYLLKRKDDKMINQDILPYVAEPIKVSGNTYNQNGWKILEIDPSLITNQQ